MGPRSRFIPAAILLIAASTSLIYGQGLPVPTGPGEVEESGNHHGSPLIGRLEDPTGMTLSGVLVELHAWNGELLNSTVTGTDGEFRFDGIYPGQYSLKGSFGKDQFEEPIIYNGGLAPVEVRIGGHPRITLHNEGDPGAARDRVSVNDLAAPAAARSKLVKAEKALKENKAEKALHLANEVLQLAPHWARAWLLRGLVHQQTRDYTAAHQDFLTATQADPGDGEALAALGGSYVHDQNWTKAEFYLQRATTIAPEIWQGWFELSRMQLLQGHYAAAAASARRALNVEPAGPPGCRYFLATAEAALGHMPAAAEQYRLFLASNPPPSQAVNDAAHKLQMIEAAGEPTGQPARPTAKASLPRQ